MQFVTVPQFSGMILKGSKRIIENQNEIDAINVFPVADSDTGSNLASTLLGIKEILEARISDSGQARLAEALAKRARMTVSDLTDDILKSVFANSRGNSGMMMASYLKGFLSPLKGKNKFFLSDLIHASKNGRDSARDSIAKPIDGTMLDVMNAFCFSLESKSKNDSLLLDVFYKATQDTKIALLATKKKLKVLEENHVVDAGALGFTHFAYGFYEGLSNKNLALTGIELKPKQDIKEIGIGKFSHEVIFTIQNSTFNIKEIKEMFDSLGDSLGIIESQNRVKIHIHTDKPEVVRETAELTGEVVEIRMVEIGDLGS